MLKGVKIIYGILACVILVVSLDRINAAERLRDAADKILHDEKLIVPGVGSNGIMLGEDIDGVMSRFGRKGFRISRQGGTKELFDHVFKVESRTKIYFNSIFYNDDRKSAACVYRNRVAAIIGFDNNRVTIDSVNLRSGINSLIFHYGNRNLALIRGGSNGIYAYPELGFAVFDDGMDDTIDMYIVFPSRGDTGE